MQAIFSFIKQQFMQNGFNFQIFKKKYSLIIASINFLFLLYCAVNNYYRGKNTHPHKHCMIVSRMYVNYWYPVCMFIYNMWLFYPVHNLILLITCSLDYYFQGHFLMYRMKKQLIRAYFDCNWIPKGNDETFSSLKTMRLIQYSMKILTYNSVWSPHQSS